MSVLISADFEKTPISSLENGIIGLIDSFKLGTDIEDVVVSFAPETVFTKEALNYIEGLWNVAPYDPEKPYTLNIRAVTEEDTTVFYLQSS